MGKCFQCGKIGHRKEECWHRDKNGDKGNPKGSAAAAPSEARPQTAASSSAGAVWALPEYEEEEWAEDPEEEDSQWIFAGTSAGPEKPAGTMARILLDSGSDEHLCPKNFARTAPTRKTDNRVVIRDAQGEVIEHELQRNVTMKLGGGVSASAPFEVAAVPRPILSAGKMVKEGVRVVLDMKGSYLEKGNKRIPLEMNRNTFYLPAVMCPAIADNGPDGGGATGSGGAGVDAPVATKTVRGLSAWSGVSEMKTRLRQLGAPIYGEKTKLWSRLVEYERLADGEKARQAEMIRQAEERGEQRDEALVKKVKLAEEPSKEEVELHNLTHIPAKPWCPICIAAKAGRAPHRAVPPDEKTRAPTTIALDYLHLKADCTKEEDDSNNAWATALVGVDTGLNYPFAASVLKKGPNEKYIVSSLIAWVKQLCHRKLKLRYDNEPAMVELAERVLAEAANEGISMTLDPVPPYSHTSNGSA